MPSRRFVQKGSFSSHFDDLVARFPERAAREVRTEPAQAQSKPKAKGNPHTFLFDRAWEVAPGKRRRT